MIEHVFNHHATRSDEVGGAFFARSPGKFGYLPGYLEFGLSLWDAQSRDVDAVPEEHAVKLLFLMASLACALNERSHPSGFVEAWQHAAHLTPPMSPKGARSS